MAAAYVEYTGSLTNTTVTIAANLTRKALIIGNPSDTAMTYRFGGTASATAGLPLAAGDTHRYEGDICPGSLVSIFCAGTSKAYTAYEVG